jgi:two-component system CheB/CheR fusion protein
VLTLVDITEVRRTQDREKAALGRLAVVVRDACDAVTVQDLAGRTIAWNPGAARLYGWSEAEALAMNVRDRIPRELRAGALDKLNQLGRADILEPYRTRRMTKAGATLDVWMTATALVNESGEIYGIATTEREDAKSAEAPL